MNASSSRSHAVLCVMIQKRHRPKLTTKTLASGVTTEEQEVSTAVKATAGKLYCVDLAGSERAKKSGARGSRMEELKAINSGQIDPSEASTVAPVDTRRPCPNCGRKFLPERLGRHIKVCEDLKRGKEWRGTWKSPHSNSSQNLLSSFKV